MRCGIARTVRQEVWSSRPSIRSMLVLSTQRVRRWASVVVMISSSFARSSRVPARPRGDGQHHAIAGPTGPCPTGPGRPALRGRARKYELGVVAPSSSAGQASGIRRAAPGNTSASRTDISVASGSPQVGHRGADAGQGGFARSGLPAFPSEQVDEPPSMRFGIAGNRHEGAFRHFGRPHDVPRRNGVPERTSRARMLRAARVRRQAVPGGEPSPPSWRQTWWTSWTSRTMRSSAQGKGSSRSPSRTRAASSAARVRRTTGLPRRWTRTTFPGPGRQPRRAQVNATGITWPRVRVEPADRHRRPRGSLPGPRRSPAPERQSPSPLRAKVSAAARPSASWASRSAWLLLSDHGEPGERLGVFGRVRVHRIRERRAADHAGADGRRAGRRAVPGRLPHRPATARPGISARPAVPLRPGRAATMAGCWTAGRSRFPSRAGATGRTGCPIRSPRSG